MQLIVSGLGLAALLALALAFPLVAEEKGFGAAVRSGAFSLAAVLVIYILRKKPDKKEAEHSPWRRFW